ncbi:MAG TPA: glycosyltransferase [Chloroflexota bacterium]|nr:glycosyltransferase [Chloroflexota bacterium]
MTNTRWADEWQELKEYLGGEFRPELCHQTTDLVAREFTRSPSEGEFYHTSLAYLYDLTAFSMSGTKEPYRSLIRFLVPPGARLLDYGCGIGSDGLKFLAEGYPVSFADFQNPSTAYLQWRLQQRGTTAEVYDVEHFPDDAHFDLAYSFDVLEHVADPFSFLEHLEAIADHVAVNFIVEEHNTNFPMHYSHDWEKLERWITERNTLLFHSHLYPNSKLLVYKVGSVSPRRPLLSVVIPTHNRQDLLEKVLLALTRQTLAAPFQVIVADDGSTDRTSTFLADYQALFDLRVISLPQGGPARARNAALSLAEAPLVVFLDDDITPDPTFLEQHLTFHLRQPAENVAALGHVDWHHDLEISPFMEYITGAGSQLFDWNRIRQLPELDYAHFYTCNLSLKRDFLRRERFDESFPYPVYEDIELGYRLKTRHGLRLLYHPSARAEHLDIKSYAGFKGRQYRAGTAAVYFATKHPELRIVLGIEQALQARSTSQDDLLPQVDAAIAEVEKVNLSKLMGLRLGEHLLANYFALVLGTLYQEGLFRSYQKGILDALRSQPPAPPRFHAQPHPNNRKPFRANARPQTHRVKSRR